MACRYPLCASGLVKLFKTATFACSRSGRRRTDLVVDRLARGCDFRFMIDGLLATDQSSNRHRLPNFRVARDSPAIGGKRQFELSASHRRIYRPAPARTDRPTLHLVEPKFLDCVECTMQEQKRIKAFRWPRSFNSGRHS